MDYSKMVQIDEYNLDREWRVHPEFVLQCGEALAKARRELDEAKEAAELTAAEVDKHIRESADKKPTEREIENRVMAFPSVQEANGRLIEAKYNVFMLEAAKAGLEARGNALANLVKLHGMSYFAEPSADIEARGKLDDIRQEAVRSRVKIGKATEQQSEEAPVRRRKTAKE